MLAAPARPWTSGGRGAGARVTSGTAVRRQAGRGWPGAPACLLACGLPDVPGGICGLISMFGVSWSWAGGSGVTGWEPGAVIAVSFELVIFPAD